MSHPTGSIYRHSGKFPAWAPLVTLAVAAGVGGGAGAAYGVLVWLIPFIYVNFIGTCAVGLLVGWITQKLAAATRIRNTGMVALNGFIAGLAAFYASWVGWVFALAGYDPQLIILSPSDLFLNLAPALAEEGVWGLTSDALVSGWLLYGVWIIEAGIILGIACIYPSQAIADLAFDEDRQAWASDRFYLPPFEPLAPPVLEQISGQLQQGKMDGLAQLRRTTDDAMAFTQLVIAAADPAAERQFLTARGVTVFIDRDGEAKSNSTDIVKNMIIDADIRNALTHLGELAPAGQDESPYDPSTGPAPPDAES